MKLLQVKNRDQWRAWLRKNHATETEIWLVYYKKHTGKQSIGYPDSVEEALCFGWIDGIKKRIDDEKYTHKFTPRKKTSRWSPLNIKRAEKMIAEKKMTSAGRAVFEQRKEYDQEFLKSRAARNINLPPGMEHALRANRKAWENFKNLAPSHRKQYILWLINAKKDVTRQKRLKEAIILLERDKKLGMK
ncbi:MAG: bacteriocin-protection protein [FCB group bacterium]|nr:bacteriocin-protection protein [FCB group bacterium]